MFRNKILLSNLVASCKNHVRNGTEITECFAYYEACRRLLPQQNFSSNSIDANGFSKFLSLNSTSKLKINSNEFSVKSDPRCWKCNQYLEFKSFCCSSCGALQYPKEYINFFELFGIPQSYEIDLEDLSKKFKNLQMVFHPDKFVNKSKKEMDISEMYSRIINKAYTVLKDPSKRGFYILELSKMSLDKTQSLGQEFLMLMMEKNEEVEGVNSENQLLKLSIINSREMDKEIEKIAKAFNSNRLTDAKIHLHKLNYFINLDIKIKEKQSNFLSLEK